MRMLFSLILVFPFVGCAYGHTDEECAIYSLVINSLYIRADSKLMVINAKTSDSFAHYLGLAPGSGRRTILEKITPAAWEDFKLQNTFPTSVEVSSLHLHVKTVSFDRDPINANDFWSVFYQKFPGSDGLISLSQVGFDRGSRQAVVYVWRGCGFICGDGYVVLLSRSSGSWKIMGKYLAGVS